jgi:glycosyltransferase involved in cell wall biosynthesis
LAALSDRGIDFGGIVLPESIAAAKATTRLKVSVIVATFNRGYIVGQALSSVLNQSYGDFEILVVDDGSSDDTQEVVEKIDCEKVRYIRHDHNRGYSAACNSGISAATGDLVGFLDSDDLWKPDKLERQVSFFSRHPEVDVVFSDVEIAGGRKAIPSLVGLLKCFPKIIDGRQRAEEHVLSGREIYLCLLEEIPIKPTAMLAKREMYERVGNFDECWPSGTDWDLFLRFSKSGCFGYIDRTLAVQRRTQDATHVKFREEDKRFLLSVFLKEKAKLKNDPEGLAAVNRGILSHYNNLGWEYLHSGHRTQSLIAYMQGFRETWEPLMLLRAASALTPLGLRRVVRAALKRDESG